MTTTTQTAERRLAYNRTIGLTTIRIRGFYYPWSSAIGEDGRLYVLRRCHDADPRDEYLGTFGSWGEGDGQFVWPVSIVIDQEQRIFISDEHLNRVTIMSTDGDAVHCEVGRERFRRRPVGRPVRTGVQLKQ